MTTTAAPRFPGPMERRVAELLAAHDGYVHGTPSPVHQALLELAREIDRRPGHVSAVSPRAARSG